jgi:hypothetical protein
MHQGPLPFFRGWYGCKKMVRSLVGRPEAVALSVSVRTGIVIGHYDNVRYQWARTKLIPASKDGLPSRSRESLMVECTSARGPICSRESSRQTSRDRLCSGSAGGRCRALAAAVPDFHRGFGSGPSSGSRSGSVDRHWWFADGRHRVGAGNWHDGKNAHRICSSDLRVGTPADRSWIRFGGSSLLAGIGLGGSAGGRSASGGGFEVSVIVCL